MAIEVFNRYEKKYQVSEDVFAKLQDRLFDYMELDFYNREQFTYPICNIYYDSADNYLIRTSLSKPTYKEKLRLRSYGTPTEGSTVYAEIKKKYLGLTNKRRSGLKLNEAYQFLSNGNLPILRPYMNGQVLQEIQYILSQRKLLPAVYLSYERRALFDSSSDLRISFDTNIVARRYDLRLESGSYGRSLIRDGVWVLEIKTALAYPLWLTRLLSEYGIYPKRFSKYGTECKTSPVPFPAGAAAAAAATLPVPARAITASALIRA